MGPIVFQLDLAVNINENDWQIKFEVHISQNVAKMTSFQPKIGQDATFAHSLYGHNSAIFYSILTIDYTKMTSSER